MSNKSSKHNQQLNRIKMYGWEYDEKQKCNKEHQVITKRTTTTTAYIQFL